MPIDQRTALERLIRDRHEDYAGLSRLIGRNPAYIQQFIKRGIPKKLDEGDRRTLARYFGIPEDQLGGPTSLIDETTRRLIAVPRLEIGASAGPGAFPDEERPHTHIGFDKDWLRRLSRGRPCDLSLIQVSGDSMSPTLADGDDILVDTGDAAAELRDGIYVLRQADALMVKRIALTPDTNRVSVRSENHAYPSWPDCKLSALQIVGRVIWAGRAID